MLLANGRWAVAVRFDQEWAAQPDDLGDEDDQIHQ